MAGPYAHTTDGPESEWEHLDRHLAEVASLAELFAAKFGAGPFGRAAGLLHDLGKEKARFQARLRDPKIVEPHAAEGAKAAIACYYKRCPPPFKAELGRLLAFVIAGHHAGLANGADAISGMRTLDERLADKHTEKLASRLTLPTLDGGLTALATARKDPFAWAFFARMLFSALVDADRLATEVWSNTAAGTDDQRGRSKDLMPLLAALDRHIADNFGAKADGSDLDLLRAEVLADCRAAAEVSPGLFSLTVPTGGGKTLSSLAFALEHAIRHDLDRVIYVIPFTSIIDQTAEVFRTALGDIDAILEHHSAFDDGKITARMEAEGDVAVQRLRLAAQNWDRPIIVTTAVQFFESLFSNRPGRCRKLHNVARSVVVLDEAQILPIHLLRPALAALKELARGYGASIVLCTATQPAVTREAFASAVTSRPPTEAIPSAQLREIITPGRNLYGRLRRVRSIVEGQMTDSDLVAALASVDQGLVIVNNRRHARDLFQAMHGAGIDGAFHLTTTMTAAHRQHVLGRIRARLLAKQTVRLASTSLIEAGVDVSFKAVWRARAGLDQIVQAAGRCNRNGELGENGGVLTIFQPEEREGRGVPHELKKNAEATDIVLRGGLEPLSPEAVTAYFRSLLWARDDGGSWRQLDDVEVGDRGELSWKGIMEAITKSAPGLNFAFADIAQAFRMIEQAMVPVIIPASIDTIAGVADDLVASIPHRPSIGGVMRELQRHIVQIPSRDRDGLIQARSASVVAKDKYAEQFVVLTEAKLYTPKFGFDLTMVRDPAARSVGDLIM